MILKILEKGSTKVYAPDDQVADYLFLGFTDTGTTTEVVVTDPSKEIVEMKIEDDIVTAFRYKGDSVWRTVAGGGGGTDTYKVKVDGTDTADYLENKLQQGTNVTITKSGGKLVVNSTASGGSGVTVYADLATIKAVDTTTLISGTLAQVVTLGQYVFVSTSTDTSDDSRIIQPTTGNGRWLLQAGASVVKKNATLKQLGAVGDGVFNDTTTITNEINSTASEKIILDDNAEYKTTADIPNIYGKKIIGKGKIIRNYSASSNRQVNSESDHYQHIFGREYLSAFHKAIIAEKTTPTNNINVVFSGDSTTVGYGNGVDQEFVVTDLFRQCIKDNGMSYVNAILSRAGGWVARNSGYAGEDSYKLDNTRIAEIITINPKLVIFRWGINDPNFLKATHIAGQSDNYEAEKNLRRGLAEYVTSMRSALTKFRASCPAVTSSIILMTPTSTDRPLNGQANIWHETINESVRQMARDFECCFIDTYSLFKDAKNGLANAEWMNIGGLHPMNVYNVWLQSIVQDVCFPSVIKEKYGNNRIRNSYAAEEILLATSAPSTYREGVNLNYATLANGFPADGFLETIVSVNKIVRQTLTPYFTNKIKSTYIRNGYYGTDVVNGTVGWGEWSIIGNVVGATVASATTITAPSTVFHVSGTTAISTITVPYTGFTGQITIIPDGIFTFTTGGNIYEAYTAVVGRAIQLVFDGTAWYRA